MTVSVGFIRTRYLGDSILLIPLIREVIRAFPKARITVIANKGTTYPLERIPGVSALTMETAGNLGRLGSTLSLAWKVRGTLDVLFDFTVSDRSRFLSRLSKAQRLGAAGSRSDFRKSDPWGTCIPIDLDHGPDHVTVQHGKLLSALGFPVTGVREKAYDPDPLWIDRAGNWVGSRLRAGAPLLFLHPGGRHWFKRWPPERFALLADQWVSRTGGSVVVAGASSERTLVESVLSGTRNPGIHPMVGEAVGLLDGVIRQATVFVGNDSAPLHMADAAHIPLVGLFGSTLPSVWGPTASPRREVVYHPLPCSPCTHTGCTLGEENCLASVSVAEVFGSVEKVLG